MKNIAQEIESLRGLEVAELVERYKELFGKPPRLKHRAHLWKRCAWTLQEKQFGGLSETAKHRLEELIGEIDLPLPERQRTVAGKLRGKPKPGDPIPGTTLVRRWRGQEIRVEVSENGFEFDGVLYKSLSAVAKAVTGSHWSGKLFFGLRKRKAR